MLGELKINKNWDELGLIKLLLCATLAYQDNQKTIMVDRQKLYVTNYVTVQGLASTMAIRRLHEQIKDVNEIKSIQELMEVINYNSKGK